MFDMHTDTELQRVLSGLPQSISGRLVELLCREALIVCSQDVPGNFVQLPQGDAASALVMARVISRHSRQPRILYVPDVVLRNHAENFRLIAAGVSIRALDTFLSDVGYARNWLGTIAFVHAAEQPGKPGLRESLKLLEGQLSHNASLLLDFNGAAGDAKAFADSLGADMAWQFDTGILVLRCQRQYEPNSSIPASLVTEFEQDDPVRRGIFTLMSENERFQLYFAVRRLLPQRGSFPVRFIEVGSFEGGTFYEICRALQRQNMPFQGISVEPELGPQLRKVLQLFDGSAVHLQMFSQQAAPLLASYLEGCNLPELIVIDGDHSYEGVCSDIRDYYPLLAPGGMMIFHDYLPPRNAQNSAFIHERMGGQKPGVGEACRELLEGEYGLEPIDLPLLYPTNPVQTMACQPIIPGIFSTVRAYRKTSDQERS